MNLIDLGEAADWAPPQTPRPRGRLARRWPSALAVLALAGALLTADTFQTREPVLHVAGYVIEFEILAGRLYVKRVDAGQRPELSAYALGGRRLWTLPGTDPDQVVTLATPGVVLLATGATMRTPPPDRAVTALDAGTGRELWRRSAAAPHGAAGGRILLEDLGGRGAAEPAAEPVADFSINRTPPQVETRLVAVDERTGAPAWSATVPAGAQVEYDIEQRAVRQLGPDGVLQTRDLVTGAVLGREQLAWSGTPSWFTTGAVQVVVSTAGRRGADVFDRATGRWLWNVENSWLHPCGTGRWCRIDGTGVRAFDATSGRPVWGVPDYNHVFVVTDDDAVVLGGFGTSAAATHDPVLLVADARTGAIRHRLDGWVVGPFARDAVVVVARPDPPGASLVGVFDPRTGGVGIVGRGDVGPQPYCTAGSGRLACLNGGLTVWKIP
ncbi:PQQ-binding-like beta-propeller repeat protein [Dactylosporangium sp. CA-233914]|uniref:outer membrane protein assembly factor BamB family protein n=1 Tax=Dactylosporangium sp. CA-233914 TaxID=3239934 RepID=UPI003D9087AE